MREIKFRGRYSPDHDWVYGDYYKYYDGSFMHVITYIDDNLMQNTFCPIDIDSLGQFTGLKDKHGVDIFEGDVVKWVDDKWENNDGWDKEYKGYMFWNQDSTGFRVQMPKGYMPSFKMMAEHLEIIGNIHQHPELLK